MNLERERERERDLEGMKTSSEVASLAFTDIFAFFVVIVAINSGWPWRRRRFQNWLGVITVVTIVVVVVVAIWFFLLYYQLHFQLLLFKSPSFFSLSLSLSLSPPRLKPRKKQVKKQKNVVHCSLSYFFFFWVGRMRFSYILLAYRDGSFRPDPVPIIEWAKVSLQIKYV